MYRSAAIAMMLLAAAVVARAEEHPAKELFGAAQTPASGASAIFGSYARGCLQGAIELDALGTGWQTVRPSRNRAWGHPRLAEFIRQLAKEAQSLGWPGLLVGDMAQPRGGPMITGHASHQIGLDADIWLTPMPDHVMSTEERETMSPPSMLVEGTREADPNRLGEAQTALIRQAALAPEVERIFVHPGIKQALCGWAGGDRQWLSKVRPWWGHDRHFHVRLSCPPGDPGCRDQAPPPAGDGCGAELAWWLSEEPWKPSDKPPPKPLMLADLPPECEAILDAP